MWRVCGDFGRRCWLQKPTCDPRPEAAQSPKKRLHKMKVISREASALVFNFFSAIGIILVNKAVFSQVQFNWPGALTLLHYVVTYAALWVMKSCGLFTPSEAPMTRRLWVLAFVVGITPCVNNMALEANSVGVYQTAKLLLTPVVVCGEWLLLRKPLSPLRGLLLLIVTVASSVSMATDLTCTAWGVVICLAWIPLAAIYKIGWSAAEQDETHPWETLPLLFRLLPYSTLFLALMVPLVDPPGVASFGFTPYAMLLLAMSGIGAFLVNWSGFLVLGACSPLTHILLGQGKSSVVMLASFLFLGFNPGFKSIVGAAVAIVAMIAYTHVNIKEQEARRLAPASGQCGVPKSPAGQRSSVRAA